MLKTLDRYIDEQASQSGSLTSLWSNVGRDRRFTLLLVMSVAVHMVFYVALIKLDSWAMMRAIANGRRQVSIVTLIEIAPPPERATLRTAPEQLERADLGRLQFDPENADDVHLVPRSPKPSERRGTSGRLPPADVIEKQLRVSKGSADRDRPGPAAHQPSPPVTSPIQANRIPQLDEALTAQAPPSQATPAPPAPRQDPNATSPGSAEAGQAGSRRGSSAESSALGLEAAQGQYMAYVRAKIRKSNERIMPRDWIKDVLRDKVSADFSLVLKRDGQILSARLLRSSGYSVLDDSARQAIYIASPYEGFPPAAGNTIIFTVTVYFFTL